jgi:crossover junction endodeoxyribonuclease RusA
MYTFFLPYPPSVNSYWGFHGNSRFLTPKAKQFKAEVAHIVSLNKINLGKARLQIEIVLYPKDKRIRDIDNSIKSCLDALCQAGAFFDDSQVDVLIVQRGEIVKNGAAKINLQIL